MTSEMDAAALGTMRPELRKLHELCTRYEEACDSGDSERIEATYSRLAHDMVKAAYWLLPAARFGHAVTSLADQPGQVKPRGANAVN